MKKRAEKVGGLGYGVHPALTATLDRNAEILDLYLSRVPQMYRIFSDATAGAVTVSLPDGAVDVDYVIAKIDASGNAVTIVPITGQTILGTTSLVLAAQYNLAYLIFSKATQDWIRI